MRIQNFIKRAGAGLALSLALAGQLKADPTGGPVDHFDTVVRDDVYKPIWLDGGEITEVTVTTNASVELIIRDADGDVVMHCIGSDCKAFVRPAFTGRFYIEVRNLDLTPTDYEFRVF
jgi:hypothetical protein